MHNVTVEDRGPVSIIRINRPDKMNAISSAVAVGIQDAMQAFDRSAQRVAILAGTGDRAFSAGVDIADLPELWRCIPNVGFKTDKPVIAATSGWCIGGAIVIVMMCDLMISTEDTVFHYPEARVGLTFGMISSLATRIPHKIAMELMLLGNKIPARRAYEVGFVNRVVDNGTHEDAAFAMASELAEAAPLVVTTLKRLVNDHVLPSGPVERMVEVSAALSRVRDSDDMREGMAAFRERRPPRFSGR